MIRFITNILDIKNILGMQRALPPAPPAPTPDPELVANINAIRTQDGNPKICMAFSGNITIQGIYQGSSFTITLPDGWSGAEIPNIYADPETDVTAQGAITDVIIYNYYGYNYVAISDTVTAVIFADSLADALYTLDLRNAASLSSLPSSGALFINRIYALATNENVANSIASLISNSTIANGEVWINNEDAYAAEIVAAAAAKGWTVYSYE